MLGKADALPGGTGLPGGAGDVTIVNGTTLDLGGLSGIPAVNDVYLTDGMITDGTLSLLTNAFIQAQYGEIDASLSGAAGRGEDSIRGAAILPGRSARYSHRGHFERFGVFDGHDQGDGRNARRQRHAGGTGSTVKVGSDATSPVGTLGGTGTLPGSVTITTRESFRLARRQAATRSRWGSSIPRSGRASTITWAARTPAWPKSTAGDNQRRHGRHHRRRHEHSALPGALPLRLVELSGGAGFGLAPTNTALVDNSPGSSIDVAVSGTPRYWETNSTLGGNGNWDGTTANWFASPRAPRLCRGRAATLPSSRTWAR